jgi:signal peptidase I
MATLSATVAADAPQGAAPAITAKTAVPRRHWRKAARIVERLLAVAGLILIVYLSCFRVSQMTSGSMSPTLKGNGRPDSDWVLTEKVTHWFRAPRRWELIAFRNVEGIEIMKRVIGLPREKVRLEKAGTFFINDGVVERPESIREIKYYAWGKLNNKSQLDPEAGYFVLGDDSKDSQDSRFEKSVAAEEIIGRPWLIVWPPSRIDFVNP